MAPSLDKGETRSLVAIEAETSDDSMSVAVTRHYLAALESVCRDSGRTLFVVFVPGQGELQEDDHPTEDLSRAEQRAYRTAFFRTAQAIGLKTVDLLPPFRAARSLLRTCG